MYSESHEIVLVKPSKRYLRDDPISGNMTAMLASVNNKSLAVRGWTLAAVPQEDSPQGHAWTRTEVPTDDGSKAYDNKMFMVLTFERTDDKKPDTYEAASIVRTLAVRAPAAQYGSWELATVNGAPYELPEENDAEDIANMVGYADVSLPDDDEWSDHFAHLFGLDAHIGRVRSALNAAVDSAWVNRFHVALIGPPGCGKSDIGASVRAALGDDAVLQMDATATTSAGAIDMLTEREILPRVIILEEIEKAPEAAMTFLLGVLDQRAEVRKITARKKIQREVKCFAIATVNDVRAFEKLQAGALASRFPNKIFFNRPSRDTLALILTREVSKVNGDAAWINPTLDYCDDHDITDPRQVISLCLCGGNSWLKLDADGKSDYAKMLDATSEPTE